MRWPLARQILTPMVGILLVTVGLASALAAWLATLQVQSRIEGQLRNVAQVLAAANFPLESSVLMQAGGLTGLELVLVDADGKATAASNERLAGLANQSAAKEGKLDPTRSVASGSERYFHMLIHVDRRAIGGERRQLHVFYPQDAWQAARWQAIWPPLATGGAAMFLVALAAMAVARHVTQPIAKLQTQVARIAGGDFSPAAAPARNDEVRDLALAVNQMAERLAEYEARTRQQERLSTLGLLGGGIAHQIRNAATGCRLALDLHERDCPLNNAGDNGHAPLAVATRQLQQIESHISRFLGLGRVSPQPRHEVDLAEAVRGAIALVETGARHMGVMIELQPVSEPIVVQADRESLEQMAVNLLMNAVQATAASLADAGDAQTTGDDSIIVRVAPATDTLAAIEIGDPGPGPSPEIASRLFQPFATDKPGGTGLGLVVARRIAEDHGGTIRWRRSGERTWFVVELPIRSGGAS